MGREQPRALSGLWSCSASGYPQCIVPIPYAKGPETPPRGWKRPDYARHAPRSRRSSKLVRSVPVTDHLPTSGSARPSSIGGPSMYCPTRAAASMPSALPPKCANKKKGLSRKTDKGTRRLHRGQRDTEVAPSVRVRASDAPFERLAVPKRASTEWGKPFVSAVWMVVRSRYNLTTCNRNLPEVHLCSCVDSSTTLDTLVGFAIFIDKISKFQTKMSWVRTAVENVKLQGYERLHQTVFGGYGTKPDVRFHLCCRV